MHGGNAGRPITHGRYSKIHRPRIKELLAQHEADPDPLNLLPELALLRSLIEDYVERYDEMTDALLAWHESWGTASENPKPRQVIDILSVGKFIADIGKLTGQIQEERKKGLFGLDTLNRVVEQLGAELVFALIETVEDESLRSSILACVQGRWLSIRMDTGIGSTTRSRESQVLEAKEPGSVS